MAVGDSVVLVNVNRSGQTLEQILIGEVAASSDTQTTGLAEVERSVREIERITGVTVREADHLGTTAQVLAEQAVELEARARRFRLDGVETMPDDAELASRDDEEHEVASAPHPEELGAV
jgi:hypothetical protein